MAQVTASTALANSTKTPSPVSLTMRPAWAAIFGSMISRLQGTQTRQGTRLIDAHETRVTDYVG